MYRRRRFYRRWRRPVFPFIPIIWLVGLFWLFTRGRIFPGILVLVALTVLFSALFIRREPLPPDDEEPWQPRPWTSPAPPPPPVPPAPPTTPFVSNLPATPAYPVDRLPSECPRCGAPVRPEEVVWRGRSAADCGFCGSNLPLK